MTATTADDAGQRRRRHGRTDARTTPATRHEPTARGGRRAETGDSAVGLPPVPVPDDNPMTAEKVELGKLLYFDKRLSKDGTISCATCHDPTKGWTDQAPTSTGIGGQVGGANSPTVINAAYAKAQFWDGRAATLEEQALGPIENPDRNGPQAGRPGSPTERNRRLQGAVPGGLRHRRDGRRNRQGDCRVRADRAQRQLALRQVQGRRRSRR